MLNSVNSALCPMRPEHSPLFARLACARASYSWAMQTFPNSAIILVSLAWAVNSERGKSKFIFTDSFYGYGIWCVCVCIRDPTVVLARQWPSTDGDDHVDVMVVVSEWALAIVPIRYNIVWTGTAGLGVCISVLDDINIQQPVPFNENTLSLFMASTENSSSNSWLINLNARKLMARNAENGVIAKLSTTLFWRAAAAVPGMSYQNIPAVSLLTPIAYSASIFHSPDSNSIPTHVPLTNTGTEDGTVPNQRTVINTVPTQCEPSCLLRVERENWIACLYCQIELEYCMVAPYCTVLEWSMQIGSTSLC